MQGLSQVELGIRLAALELENLSKLGNGFIELLNLFVGGCVRRQKTHEYIKHATPSILRVRVYKLNMFHTRTLIDMYQL